MQVLKSCKNCAKLMFWMVSDQVHQRNSIKPIPAIRVDRPQIGHVHKRDAKVSCHCSPGPQQECPRLKTSQNFAASTFIIIHPIHLIRPDPPPKEHHDHAKDGSPGRKLEMPLPDYRIYRTGCGQYLELSGTCCVCAMYVCSLPNSCEVLRGLSLQLCNPNTFLPFCFDKPVNGTTKVPQLPPAPGLNT